MNVERHAVDRAGRTFGCAKVRLEIANRKQKIVHSVRNLGSRASRTASPKMFAGRTSPNMKTNDASSVHHTTGSRTISDRAELTRLPQLSVLGSTPIPTYANTASNSTSPLKRSITEIN